MSKMHFGLAVMALVTVAAVPPSARGDEGPTRHYRHHPGPRAFYHYVDRCGPLHVAYDYHRELKYTYGWHFDPRRFDETEPHYYYGAVRAYPHYWPPACAAGCYYGAVGAYPHYGSPCPAGW